MMRENANYSHSFLKKKFQLQASDPNMFYRGVDFIFWRDMTSGGWGAFNLSLISGTDLASKGLSRASTWTWITGDQHLSNFGAWKNRHGDIVFGVNDFDEAAIYDFQMDVWRLAVSMYDHTITNGLSDDDARNVVHAFANKYVETMLSYMGNDKATLYEVTTDHAHSELKEFLKEVATKARSDQLDTFTSVDADGNRHFVHDHKTRLQPMSRVVEQAVRASWSAEGYGATLNKIGWKEREWSDDFFRIVDLAERLDSGDGSYGVERYYVLIAGSENLLAPNDAIILDVKETSEPAVRAVLSPADAAWYDNLFINEAARAVNAQRRLTSYTDPFTGWIELNGKAFVVRQRSPWKASFPVEMLTTAAQFNRFVEQVAVVTATSHARGTVGRSPAQFKEVITHALGHKKARHAWGKRVTEVAESYRQQVLADYQCFKEFVQDKFT